MASNPMRDFNMAAVWAGLTAFVWYGFGALPLHLEVAGQLGLSASEASCWIFYQPALIRTHVPICVARWT